MNSRVGQRIELENLENGFQIRTNNAAMNGIHFWREPQMQRDHCVVASQQAQLEYAMHCYQNTGVAVEQTSTK